DFRRDQGRIHRRGRGTVLDRVGAPIGRLARAPSASIVASAAIVRATLPGGPGTGAVLRRVGAPTAGAGLHGPEARARPFSGPGIEDLDREVGGGDAQAHGGVVHGLTEGRGFRLDRGLDGLIGSVGSHGSGLAAILRSSARLTRYCWIPERTLVTVQYRT